MYKIIGADGKEYGPHATDVLKKWLAEGRINAQTKVLPEGGTEWQTLGDIPELAAAIPATAVPTPSLPTMQPGPGSAASRVKGPAIALIVTASLGILWYLFNAVITLVGGSGFEQRMPANAPPALRAFFEGMHGPVAALISLGIVALNAFVLFGAIKMMRLKSYGLAMAACIVAMLPCQCCCLLGLPFGIWGIVMLSKAEVKSQFH